MNTQGTDGGSVTVALPEPLLIEMGIGWTRNPKDRSKLTSAYPKDYVAEIERLRNWRPIDTAPKDTDVLMGWWRDWPERQWECATGLAICTKGGWLHGQATHWMPLPEPPKELL